jgi:hypothetical protein
MRYRKAVGVAVAALLVAVAALGLCTRSGAQIGDGWIQYFPSVALHHSVNGTLYIINPAPNYFDDGRAHYDNDGTVESFALYNHTSNRIEIRVMNNYTSGMRQFEGVVWVDPPTDNECVMQVFGGSTSATAAMFRAFNVNGGELRHYSSSSGTIASGIYGTWVQLNVIHDADAGRVYAYINGAYANNWADHGPATHYFKYGIYGTHDDAHPAYVYWTSVSFFYQ